MKKSHAISQIQYSFEEKQYVYSLHAVDQSITRHITRKEIEEAVMAGEIIEKYPDDKYGASCLIYGKTELERPLHVVCTIPSKEQVVKIITVYEPNPDDWINFKQRK